MKKKEGDVALLDVDTVTAAATFRRTLSTTQSELKRI
jgi:hypothetical protein